MNGAREWLRQFFSTVPVDPWNMAWLASGVALAAVLLLVPNEGAGVYARIAVAAVAIVLTAALRIRDTRRERERKRRERGG